ncbi:MAG: DNA-binding protein [Pseudomonadota bacterium]
MSTLYLTRPEQAEYLKSQYGYKISPYTLASYACRGGGPREIALGHRRLSTAAWLDNWVTSKISDDKENLKK